MLTFNELQELRGLPTIDFDDEVMVHNTEGCSLDFDDTQDDEDDDLVYLDNDEDDDEFTTNVPDPTCCSEPDSLCPKCKAKQEGMAPMNLDDQRNDTTLWLSEFSKNHASGEPMPLATLEFPNPFDRPPSQEAVMNRGNVGGPAYVTNAPAGGLGVPELVFANPFA